MALHRRGSQDLVTPMVRKDTRHLAEKAAVAIASHGMGKTAMSTAAEDLEAAEKGQSSAGAKFMARAEMEKRHNQQSALAEARKMQEQLWTGDDSGDELSATATVTMEAMTINTAMTRATMHTPRPVSPD